VRSDPQDDSGALAAEPDIDSSSDNFIKSDGAASSAGVTSAAAASAGGRACVTKRKRNRVANFSRVMPVTKPAVTDSESHQSKTKQRQLKERNRLRDARRRLHRQHKIERQQEQMQEYEKITRRKMLDSPLEDRKNAAVALFFSLRSEGFSRNEAQRLAGLSVGRCGSPTVTSLWSPLAMAQGIGDQQGNLVPLAHRQTRQEAMGVGGLG
jgi:TolA-binding protein